jgi:hypothetical protein
MPNPSTTPRGPCQTCDAYGGPADASGATICKRPQDSRKKVCRMPEAGCAFWRPVKALQRAAATPANDYFADLDRECFRARR